MPNYTGCLPSDRGSDPSSIIDLVLSVGNSEDSETDECLGRGSLIKVSIERIYY